MKSYMQQGQSQNSLIQRNMGTVIYHTDENVYNHKQPFWRVYSPDILQSNMPQALILSNLTPKQTP